MNIIIDKINKQISRIASPLILKEIPPQDGKVVYVPQEAPLMENCSYFLHNFPSNSHASLIMVNNMAVLKIRAERLFRLVNPSTNYFVDIPDVEDFSLQSEGTTKYLISSDDTVIYCPLVCDEVIHYPGIYMNQTLENRLLDFPLHLKKFDNKYFIFVTHRETGEIQAHFDFSCKKWVFWWLDEGKSINIKNLSYKYLFEDKKMHFVDTENFIIYNNEGKKVN